MIGFLIHGGLLQMLLMNMQAERVLLIQEFKPVKSVTVGCVCVGEMNRRFFETCIPVTDASGAISFSGAFSRHLM